MRPLIPAIALALGVLVTAPAAEATIVERVVAVVGERAILLSDLRKRARPYILQIEKQVPPGAARAAQMSQMLEQLLQKMVDEELERRAANRARLTVTAREIDESIERIAAQQRLTYEQIVDEAIRSGLTETEYRQEMRRQVIEAKLLNLRVVTRIRITEEDLKSTYRRILLDERKRIGMRAAWIRIDAPKGRAAPAALAADVAKQAQRGADFAGLARTHSADARTRDAGGLLGRVFPGRMPQAISKVVVQMEVGQVSRPVRVGEALYIIKLLERDDSDLPTYDEARAELQQRVYLDKMERARRHWLEGLRRRTHVEVRL